MGREQNNTPTNATYLLKVPVLIIFLYCLSGWLSIFPAAGEASTDEQGMDTDGDWLSMARLRCNPRRFLKSSVAGSIPAIGSSVMTEYRGCSRSVLAK